jgi:hypothetical protein
VLNIENITKQMIEFPKKTESADDRGTMFTLPKEALDNITGVFYCFKTPHIVWKLNMSVLAR